MSKEYYTVQYLRPKTPAQVHALLRMLNNHGADFANLDSTNIAVTWDNAVDETAFNMAWKKEAPKHLDCVAESVLDTIKGIDHIELVGVPFEELYYYCDEVLAEHDVEEGLEVLEYMGLVGLQNDGGWILKTDISLSSVVENR